MADITVSANTSTISVDSTTNTVAVTSTPTTVTVGTSASVSNTAIRSSISVSDTGGDGSLTYNSLTGEFTYTGPNQAEANARIAAAPSQVRAQLSNTAPIQYSSSTGVIGIDSAALFSGKTTDDLTEGSTNLYFTNNRSRNAISVTDTGGDGALVYTAGTGIIQYTGPSQAEANARITNAPDQVRGQITSDVSYLANSNPQFNSLQFTQSTGVMRLDSQVINAKGGSYDTPGGGAFVWDFAGHINVDGGQTSGYGIRIAPSANLQLEGNITAVHGLGEGRNRFSMDTDNDGNVYLSSERRIDNFINSSSNISATAAEFTINSGGETLGSASERFAVDGGGNVTINNQYKLPRLDGAGNSFIRTNGAGQTSFSAIEGGEYNNVVVNASNIVVDWDHGAINVTNDPADFEEMMVFTGPDVPRRLRRAFIGLSLFDNDSNFITQAQANTKTLAHIATTALTVGGNLTVNGNINATGNINTENVVDLNVQDQQITLNANAASNANTSIISNRPTGTSVRLRWNEQVDKWQFTNDGSSFYNIPVTTDDLAQGATNLYFGNARVRSFIDDSITTANISEQTNLYYTTARANTAITDYDGVLTPSSLTATGNIQGAYVKGNGSELSGLTTTQVGEGTNLYYTTARANSAIADYTGTISTGNTISGTTVTATTELKTNQVKPNSSDVITVAETNDIKLGAKISDVSYLTGNIVQAGTYIDRPTAGAGLSDGRVLTTSSAFDTAVGSTKISGMVATLPGTYPAGLGGIGGSATYVEGSPDVVVTGLQTLNTVGAPFYIYGVPGSPGVPSNPGRTTEDPANHFRPGMQIITALSSLHQTGAMPKNAYALSLNSSDAGGNANIRMSENATFSKTYTISGLVDQIGLFNTVENPTTGDRRALHGVDASFGVTDNDFVGMSTTDHPVEGTSQLGANYFQHFSNTSLPSSINANITPSMITTANVASTSIQDIIEMKSPNGYYRFPDSVLVGDQSINTSRNTYFDSVPGFGLNIQWSGNGDTAKYGTTAQTAMTFQAFTDNALQGQSGFEDKAGPRIMLSSFTGNKNDAWQGWYPRQNQELGKYAWWSTTGESATPGSTVPPAAITAIASNDWDTDANMSADVIHYAAAKVAGGSKQMFLAYKDGETLIGHHNSKKVSIGHGGTINTDVRANASLTATHLTVDTTETELFNRLQLYSLTTTEINALSSPQAGQVVYNSTLGQVCVYSGVASAWQKISQATM